MYVIDWHFDPASSIAIAPALSPPQIATCRRASSCWVVGGAGPELSGAKTQTGSSVIGTSCGSFPAWTCVALPATPGSARRTGLCILSSHKSVVILRAIRNGDCAIGADVSEELAEDRLRLTAEGLGSDASAWSCADRAAVGWEVLPQACGLPAPGLSTVTFRRCAVSCGSSSCFAGVKLSRSCNGRCSRGSPRCTSARHSAALAPGASCSSPAVRRSGRLVSGVPARTNGTVGVIGEGNVGVIGETATIGSVPWRSR